jgi:hypothetical protein
LLRTSRRYRPRKADPEPDPDLASRITPAPSTWLVTGAAGFIGSNLVETLLKLDQRVVGLDNFATGHRRNLSEVQGLVSPEQWARFTFIEGDIRSLDDCRAACAGVDHVLHQAALGSVPRSLEDPVTSNAANVTGFLNMLVAARDAKVRSFTYAASSSTYGDHPALPKVEEKIGRPLSPYAVTKLVNELYAEVFARSDGFRTVGLRSFNVFGPRQDPDGAYAAVIPKWIVAIRGDAVFINGLRHQPRLLLRGQRGPGATCAPRSPTMPRATRSTTWPWAGGRTSTTCSPRCARRWRRMACGMTATPSTAISAQATCGTRRRMCRRPGGCWGMCRG